MKANFIIAERLASFSKFVASSVVRAQAEKELQAIKTLKLEVENVSSFDELHIVLKRKKHLVWDYPGMSQLIDMFTVDAKVWLVFTNKEYAPNLAKAKEAILAEIKPLSCKITGEDILAGFQNLLKSGKAIYALEIPEWRQYASDPSNLRAPLAFCKFIELNRTFARQLTKWQQDMSGSTIDEILETAKQFLRYSQELEASIVARAGTTQVKLEAQLVRNQADIDNAMHKAARHTSRTAARHNGSEVEVIDDSLVLAALLFTNEQASAQNYDYLRPVAEETVFEYTTDRSSILEESSRTSSGGSALREEDYRAACYSPSIFSTDHVASSSSERQSSSTPDYGSSNDYGNSTRYDGGGCSTDYGSSSTDYGSSSGGGGGFD